jgi:hypothetical protein
MNAGQYEVARRKFVDYLQLAFIPMSPLRYSARAAAFAERVQACLVARRPRTMATHKVKPSRPADGV